MQQRMENSMRVNEQITLGDILIQADAIGTTRKKSDMAKDLDLLHIRENAHSAPVHDSVLDPLTLFPDKYKNNKPLQQLPKRENTKVSKKMVKKSRAPRSKISGEMDVPLFPRNREDTFALSGTSILKPPEMDENYEEEEVQESAPWMYQTIPEVSQYVQNVLILKHVFPSE